LHHLQAFEEGFRIEWQHVSTICPKSEYLKKKCPHTKIQVKMLRTFFEIFFFEI
jgi:hypothetical protein